MSLRLGGVRLRLRLRLWLAAGLARRPDLLGRGDIDRDCDLDIDLSLAELVLARPPLPLPPPLPLALPRPLSKVLSPLRGFHLSPANLDEGAGRAPGGVGLRVGGRLRSRGGPRPRSLNLPLALLAGGLFRCDVEETRGVLDLDRDREEYDGLLRLPRAVPRVRGGGE